MLFTADMKTLISCQNQNANISIPNSVTQIGDKAFYNCNSLEDVDIPDSVTTIGEDILGRNYYYNEEQTYEKYNGSYAQDVEGLSDQTIDAAFEGDPDAYWNID